MTNSEITDIIVKSLKATVDVLPVRRTKKAIIDSWKGKFEKIPTGRVIEMESTMSNFMNDRFANVHLEVPAELSAEELILLGEELTDIESIQNMLKARREAIKDMVFSHLDIKHGDEDESPTQREMMPSIGKSFSREGRGSTDASINLDKLKNILSEEEFEKVVERRVVETINEDKVADALREDPTLIQRIIEGDAVVPGTAKTPRFLFRNITNKELKEMGQM